MIRNSDIDRLRGLFAKRLIATMDMLKKTVGTVADLTVFRKLRELDYCTSYSHRGRFYTLRELAEFDENGLWWIRSVGFSSRGTLVATAEGLVNASEAGYAVEELDAIVRVGTKDVLPKLAWEKRLRRTRIRNRNVYFSPKRSIREQQIASRRVWEAQPSVSKSIAAQDVLPDELKAAIILFFSLLDERERRVYAGLESLKLGYGGDRQMAEILGLDVSTVARGRRELLEHDVNVERVRKAGAGRKAVEKKARSHRGDRRTYEVRGRWRSRQRSEMDSQDHEKNSCRTLGLGHSRQLSRRLVLQQDQHVGARKQQDGCWNVEGTAPTKRVGCVPRHDVGQRRADHVASTDDADRLAARSRGQPVGGNPHGRRPAERLRVTVECPHEPEEPNRRAGAEEHVESRRHHHPDRQHASWRDSIRELSVDELTDAVCNLERDQHVRHLALRETELLFDSWKRGGEVDAAEVERTVGRPQDPQHHGGAVLAPISGIGRGRLGSRHF